MRRQETSLAACWDCYPDKRAPVDPVPENSRFGLAGLNRVRPASIGVLVEDRVDVATPFRFVLGEQDLRRGAAGFGDLEQRRDEMPLAPARLGPSEHSGRGELGSVVGDDQAGLAAPGDDGVEFARHAPARDRGVRDRAETPLGDIVDDIEDAEAAAVGELVVDEVRGPARVRPGLGPVRNFV